MSGARPDFDAVVIGGGANGLTAAAVLARAGRSVLLVEQADALGGLGRQLEIAPGFRVSPLETDDGWVPPGVATGLGLTLPPPATVELPVTVAAGPGDFLSLAAEPARAAEAIRRHSAADASAWPGFTELLFKLTGFLGALYQHPAPDLEASGLGELLSLAGLGRKLRGLGRERMIELLRVMPMPVQELLDDRFESAAVKAAVAPGGLLGLRQGPRSGGTTFVLLHHLVGAARGSVRGRGRRAGPLALVEALERAARRYGVVLRTGATVERILVRHDRVTGVALGNGDELATPLVLSSADPARTLLGLVDPVWLDPELLLALRNIKFRGAESRVLYALDGLPSIPGLADPERALQGTVSLTANTTDLERAYDAAKYGHVSERPHVEITVPSLSAPSLAPAGGHVLAARVQFTPHALAAGQAWTGARVAELGDLVTRRVAEFAPDFEGRIRARSVLTPVDLERQYGLTQGALSHGELTLDQILFMRPVAGLGRHATPIDGLYLCGAGTHPGPGIPGGPGWLAARAALHPKAAPD